MKIRPEIYARGLIESLKAGEDKKKIAQNFWFMLQKNKQYKDLGAVMEALDLEYAKENNMVLAKVHSAQPLAEVEMSEIQKKLEDLFNKKIILKNIIKEKEIAGIVVKVDGKEINLSLSGKIERLNQQLLNK